MQHQYTGDVGDYSKLALLRSLAAPGHKIGVAWYLHPNTGNGDGMHRSYLKDPGKWRGLDPELFDHLSRVQQRHVGALEVALPGATFCGACLPVDARHSDREQQRQEWFEEVALRLSGCDIVFCDPDNGVAPVGWRKHHRAACKSVFLDEVFALASGGRPVIIYHHQDRTKGGKEVVFGRLMSRFTEVGLNLSFAIRLGAGTSRFYVFVNAGPDLMHQARCFYDRWPDMGAKDWLAAHQWVVT